MTFNVDPPGTLTVLTIGNAVPPILAALYHAIVIVAELPVVLLTFNVLIFKHLPELAALFKTNVALVVVRLTPAVLPLIVVALIKFGAAILSSKY
jgi:hypothetical protein